MKANIASYLIDFLIGNCLLTSSPRASDTDASSQHLNANTFAVGGSHTHACDLTPELASRVKPNVTLSFPKENRMLFVPKL